MCDVFVTFIEAVNLTVFYNRDEAEGSLHFRARACKLNLRPGTRSGLEVYYVDDRKPTTNK